MVDTSVLIALDRVGRLDLLGLQFRSLVVPLEVRRELDFPEGHRHHESGLNILGCVSRAPFDVCDSHAKPSRDLPRSIGTGEAAALAIAEQEGLILLTDDRAARATAPHLGIEIHGTLWLVILANRRGSISTPEAQDLISRLVQTGLRLSGDVVAAAIRRLR